MGSGKNWTSEEIAYIEERWGATSIPSMAKHLGRSVNAVKLKAGRMGLGRHLHSGIDEGIRIAAENNDRRKDDYEVVKRFIAYLEGKVGTGNGIGGGTVYRLYKELDNAIVDKAIGGV